MRVEKYLVQNAALSRIVEFVWHLTSDTGIEDCMLLPVLNTDLIINYSAPISYHFPGEDWQQAPTVHLRYVKTKPQLIRQSGPIDVWGVSLYPQGVYPLLHISMNCLDGQVVDVETVCPTFVSAVTFVTCSEQIESALCGWLGEYPNADLEMLSNFFQCLPSVRIGEYCEQNGIGLKKLERLVKKYTGLTPKQLQQIVRFQAAGNQLLYHESPASLADLAYLHNYSDQMHLTKEFKSYIGLSPAVFLSRHDCVKEKLFKGE